MFSCIIKKFRLCLFSKNKKEIKNTKENNFLMFGGLIKNSKRIKYYLES